MTRTTTPRNGGMLSTTCCIQTIDKQTCQRMTPTQCITGYLKFFISKIRRLKEIITDRLAGIVVNPFAFDRPNTGNPLNCLNPVTDGEVRKLLSSISSKSSPMDFVPTSVLKKCSNVFVPLITRLANMSFDEGCFPQSFKQAQITPLLKKEGLDSSDPASYRPISNLNTISKIIERLALMRLRQHIYTIG